MQLGISKSENVTLKCSFRFNWSFSSGNVEQCTNKLAFIFLSLAKKKKKEKTQTIQKNHLIFLDHAHTAVKLYP